MATVNAYASARLDEGAARAQVNQELAGYCAPSLQPRGRSWTREEEAEDPSPVGRQRTPRLLRGPVRNSIGFSQSCPSTAAAPVLFAYHTGWRLGSEILQLTWDRVDLATGEVHIYETKGNERRKIFLGSGELRAVIDRQWQIHQTLFSACPFVFPYLGEPIKRIDRVWRGATRAAGLRSKLVHDLRRTAVRNLVRARVPERVAMQLVGWKSRLMLDRYNIVSEDDLRAARERMDRLGVDASSNPADLEKSPEVKETEQNPLILSPGPSA